MYRLNNERHTSIDEVSEELRSFIRYFNQILFQGTATPTKGQGVHGSIAIIWDGTTFKLYSKAGHGQAAVWKSVTLT